jgi:hypothetical protein
MKSLRLIQNFWSEPRRSRPGGRLANTMPKENILFFNPSLDSADK